ncbi:MULTISPECIES: GMC oxidoreductase [Olivibacter]|jgi:choline dehydrogenase-like flavoprotein|uniref:GMC oxidoreductase n=1 Tax=Olivibacter oleidegradans TaxID=760123 RepID=A0ABV6HSN0_9SPHI|nr:MULTISPECIES: GMC family oxidoreductase [Olivibacter]MDM8174050.1 GMC family oxidoreductase [Olivibacter sp. 47]QEL03835.1 GMC family oxidoreductase [Olivibacter sp. LS-1]
MTEKNYDAIVIGSGISGGWAAKELTESGLKTLMLERGRNVEHVKDYGFAAKDIWDYPYRNNRSQKMLHEHPIQARYWPMTEGNVNFLVNEIDNPYVEVKRFDWVRGYQVGGKSLIWGRQSYRLSDVDFTANLRDGIAVDWPIRYKDLAPWYSYVERFAGISGNRDGISILPDGEFLPPMELNVVEKDVAARIKKHYSDKRAMIIGRVANITKPLPGRINCQYQNQCSNGCNFGGYFSTQSSTLPAAVKTGNLTVRPWSIVMEILYDKELKKAKGVRILDAENGQTYEYFAKVIFVNASALNSAWVLMNSATDIWEGGLGSSSGELGHNVMDHTLGNGARGIVEGYEDKYVYGRRANGVYIPRFQNIGDDKRSFIRGYGYQGGAGRDAWQRSIAELSIGAGLKEELCEPGVWSIGLTGFGEILPYHENRVYIDKNRKDKWGLPVLAIDAEIKENEKLMIDDIIKEGKEMLEAAGVKEVTGYRSVFAMGQGIHEMGTARMGRDPKTSVLNAHNQVWDAPNVFVTDGAAMTSSGCVNPSLTYMAMTARAAAFAVEELKKGNL